jgi:hypothetical protein
MTQKWYNELFRHEWFMPIILVTWEAGGSWLQASQGKNIYIKFASCE